MYKVLAQNWIDHEYPRHLFVEICAQCNLACSFCPREDQRGDMPWEMFTAIIDEATQYGPRTFSLHIFNEPMLYKRWPDAIRYIHSKHRGHRVLFTTNGTAINARVDDLISANPDQVFWSWRPEAKFTPETKEELRKWGRFRVRFIQEVTPESAYEEWRDWPNTEGRKLHSYGGGNIDLSAFTSAPADTSTGSLTPRACYHPWLAPAVAWNGNILLCCADPKQEEVLGHFPDQSVAEVWQGEKIKEIREGQLRGEFKGICKGCTIPLQYPDMFFKWQKR